MFIFIHDVQRYDKIETMFQGPFGAINPSQIQQLMQQVNDKNVMFFFGQNVFVLKYRQWKLEINCFAGLLLKNEY